MKTIGEEVLNLQSRLRAKREAFVDLRQQLDITISKIDEKTTEKRSAVVAEGTPNISRSPSNEVVFRLGKESLVDRRSTS